MNRHKRVRCALALLTMLTAGLLSGCVSDAASDSTLPTITVGSDTYPPYVYMDNNGDITGLDVDIAEEAFRRMGYRAEFTTIDWEQKTKLVDNGEIDCIWDCFSMDGRENDYQWAGPYLVSRQVIAVSEQSSIERMSDLAGKTIAVQATGKPEAIFLSGGENVPASTGSCFHRTYRSCSDKTVYPPLLPICSCRYLPRRMASIRRNSGWEYPRRHWHAGSKEPTRQRISLL